MLTSCLENSKIKDVKEENGTISSLEGRGGLVQQEASPSPSSELNF